MGPGKPIRVGGLRWWLAPGIEPDRAVPIIAAAMAAHARGDAPNLKSGERKRLYALRLGQGAEPDHLLKVNAYRLLPGLLHLLRPSKSRRELLLAAAAAARGLPAPVPVAAGERRRGPRLADCFLLIPIIRDVTDLRRLWFDEAPPPARRRRLTSALGEFSRRVHDAGLFQDDFAPNNFLVPRNGDRGFLVVDFERARIAPRIGRAERRWMLAKLSRHVDDASAAERMRFLLAYAGGDRSEARRWWREIAPAAAHLARRDHGRMRRNSVREGRNFARVRKGAWRGFARRTVDAGSLPPLPSGARTAPPRVRAADGFWCIEYGPRGRRAGAEIWARANTLWASGRLVPEPVAWLRGDGCGVLVLARGAEVPLGEVKDVEAAAPSVRVLVKRLGALGAPSHDLGPDGIALGPVGRWSRRALLLRPDLVAFGGRPADPAVLTSIADRLLSAPRASSSRAGRSRPGARRP